MIGIILIKENLNILEFLMAFFMFRNFSNYLAKYLYIYVYNMYSMHVCLFKYCLSHASLGSHRNMDFIFTWELNKEELVIASLFTEQLLFSFGFLCPLCSMCFHKGMGWHMGSLPSFPCHLALPLPCLTCSNWTYW